MVSIRQSEAQSKPKRTLHVQSQDRDCFVFLSSTYFAPPPLPTCEPRSATGFILLLLLLLLLLPLLLLTPCVKQQNHFQRSRTITILSARLEDATNIEIKHVHVDRIRSHSKTAKRQPQKQTQTCKCSLIYLQTGCFCVMSSSTSNVIGVSTLAQRVPTRARAQNYNGITTAMGTGTTMGSSLSKLSRRTNPRGSVLSLRAVFRPWLWPWLWPQHWQQKFSVQAGWK